MAFKSVVVLLSALLCVNALATPNAFPHNHHRAIAHRVAVPAPNPDVPLAQPPVKRSPRSRRSVSRRCKARPAPTASSTSSEAPTSSAALVNVGSDPSSVSVESSSTHTRHRTSTTEEAAPTTSKETEPTTSETPAPTTSEAPAPTTSEAPAPTTSEAPAPTTSKTHAPTTSSEEPAPTTSQSSSGSGSGSSGNSGLSFLTGTQTGQGTFYSTGLGACGITNVDTDYICAVSHLMFDVFPGWDGVNPNNNPICGKKVTATYQGKSVTVTITDRCEGCAITDLDFSPSAFSQLASFDVGRLSGMTWVWD